VLLPNKKNVKSPQKILHLFSSIFFLLTQQHKQIFVKKIIVETKAVNNRSPPIRAGTIAPEKIAPTN
jgi:hypothetical protein